MLTVHPTGEGISRSVAQADAALRAFSARVAGEGLFGEDQFSRMGLAQQIVLAAVFNHHPAFWPEQRAAVYLTVRRHRVRGIVFCFFCCGSVIHSRHSTKIKIKATMIIIISNVNFHGKRYL